MVAIVLAALVAAWFLFSAGLGLGVGLARGTPDRLAKAWALVRALIGLALIGLALVLAQRL